MPQVADADLLKPWQLSREKYKQRKRLVGDREKDTLARLAKFQSVLRWGRRRKACVFSGPCIASVVPACVRVHAPT